LDRNRVRVVVIMSAIIAVQGAPLLIFALQSGGLAFLGRLLGFGAPSISPLAWALGLAIAAIYAGLSMRSLPYIREHALDLNALKVLAIVFAFVTGTFEEFFFRKWIMDWLSRREASIAIQIVASGVAFGAVHAVWGLVGGSLRAAWTSMVFTTALGLALAGVYLLAGRQLAPAAWSHILVNLAIEPWLLLGVMGLRQERPAQTS
jgi:membrane protease YdiL (CAAX protease family)